MTQKNAVTEAAVRAAVRPGWFIPPKGDDPESSLKGNGRPLTRAKADEKGVPYINPEHLWSASDCTVREPEEDLARPMHALPECRNRRFARTAKEMYARYGMNPDPDKEMEEQDRAKFKHDHHRMYTPEQYKEMEHDLQRCGEKKGGQGYVNRTHTNQWWNVFNILGEDGFHIVGA
jgi:hypothetical protein